MEDVTQALTSMLGWMGDHPGWVLLAMYFCLQLWRRSQPFPTVEGSRVRNVESMEDFDKLISECKDSGSLLVVDYYATWCPPCRSAAPVFGEMSKVYNPKDVLFAKVNVDSARDVAQAHGISAMPTFKLFDANKNELSSLRGWSESALRDNIVKAINSK